MQAISLSNVHKQYQQGDTVIRALSDISLEIPVGKTVAIVGASGSGKSTLLSIMSGMDTPSQGTVDILGRTFANLSDKEKYTFRNKDIAVIFQSFELVPAFTALENVLLPREIRKDVSLPEAIEILERVGLRGRMHHTPNQLSGGEQQRVAIARALSQSPQILFADEPTGNLDRKTGTMVFDMLLSEVTTRKMTFVMITHDPELAKQMDIMFTLEEGRLL